MRRVLAGGLLSLFLLFGFTSQASAEELTMFAAASLTDVMKQVAVQWRASGHEALRFNFAASSTLARQLDQGAIANIFASADRQWMDWAATRHLLAAETRRDLLGNRLVVVVPASNLTAATQGMPDLMTLLGDDGRLAVGDPGNVPAGIYAQQSLTRLGLWPRLEQRLARADSVRSALQLVARGEAPAGIVYATDTALVPNVRIVGILPDASHEPIVYPFAVTRTGDTPEARALLGFLTGPEARALFHAAGFQVMGTP